jgi:hypothetical protein
MLDFPYSRAIIFISFILLPLTMATPQTFPLRIHRIDDFLARNIANKATQDASGLIRICTEFRASVYSESAWRNFSRTDGLTGCEYIQITKNNCNYIWTLPILLKKKTCFYSKKSLVVIIGTIKGIFSFKENNWIKSLVHGKLRQSSDMDNIKLKVYITSLTNFLLERYHVSDKMEIQLELDDTIIEVDKAIPPGLILNELLFNTFKYVLSIDSKEYERQRFIVSYFRAENNLQIQLYFSGSEFATIWEKQISTMHRNEINKLVGFQT